MTEVFSPDGEGARFIDGKLHDTDELLRARQRDQRRLPEPAESAEPQPIVIEAKKDE